ncbi:unnamed protein product [Vicia faba]|uniref:Replication protein A 70 kDa DNA-binding subunit B/D first OB fold domain-containing protein n=1 Tax=Vicia faba TaxID=3906 RepID=A0AAV0YP17_VICFA|nr:unnamed protein product [Vicia faba]
MARPFEMISDINDHMELWKISVKIHHKWKVTTASKEHFEMVVFDKHGHDIDFILKFTGGTTVGDTGKHDIDNKPRNLTPFVDVISEKWQRIVLCDVIGVFDEVSYTQSHTRGKNLRLTWCCAIYATTHVIGSLFHEVLRVPTKTG